VEFIKERGTIRKATLKLIQLLRLDLDLICYLLIHFYILMSILDANCNLHVYIKKDKNKIETKKY